MRYGLLISETAFQEIDNAYDYYEKQSTGLGNRFLKSLDEAYEKLSIGPQHYGYINSRKDIRGMKIENFPFVIIFKIIENKVHVIRVFNTNRNPLLPKNLYNL
jgi:hypothetical protein